MSDHLDIAGIRIQAKDAVDALFGGFVQQALWVGIDGTSAGEEWIETGVTQGADLTPGVPADVHRYFTAWGDGNSFVEVLLPGTPTVGQVQFVKTVTCETTGSGFYELGCPVGSPTPGRWVTCVNAGQFGDNLSNCFSWMASVVTSHTGQFQDSLGYGSADFHVGFESTCGVSVLDTSLVRQVRHRLPSVAWQELDSLDFRRTFLAKFPSPSAIHGSNCCNGFISGPGSTGAECVPPKDFIVFHNSQTSTSPAQQCD